MKKEGWVDLRAFPRGGQIEIQFGGAVVIQATVKAGTLEFSDVMSDVNVVPIIGLSSVCVGCVAGARCRTNRQLPCTHLVPRRFTDTLNLRPRPDQSRGGS